MYAEKYKVQANRYNIKARIWNNGPFHSAGVEARKI